MKSLVALFTSHPRSMGETYREHAVFALWVASRAQAIALFAALHALCPWLCETSASRRLKALNAAIAARGRGAPAATERQRAAIGEPVLDYTI